MKGPDVSMCLLTVLSRLGHPKCPTVLNFQNKGIDEIVNTSWNRGAVRAFLSPVKTRGYRVELVRLSVRPSVRPSVPLEIGYFVHASLV